MKSAAIFLDRDGTVNDMVYDPLHGVFDSPRTLDQFTLKPFAAEFIKSARSLGFKIFIVTNQPGLAKGTLTQANLDRMHISLMNAAGAGMIDEILVCPHHPGPFTGGKKELMKSCNCRKPRPGLILDAISRYDINAGSSWMVGDGITDIQAGKAAGCKTMLIANVKVEHLEKFFEYSIEPDHIVPSLELALEKIKAADRG